MEPDGIFLAKSELEAARPDLDQLENMLRRARLQLRLAMKPDSALRAYKAMQDAVQSFWQSAGYAQIFVQEEADTAEFWTGAKDRFRQQMVQFYEALAATRYRQVILAEHGSHLLRLAEIYSFLHQPDLTGFLSEEELILAGYRRLMDFIPDADLYSQDRLLRRKAHLELDELYLAVQDEQDRSFEKLASLRGQMADQAGLDSFSQLATLRLGRLDYTQVQRDPVKEAVRRYIVPLARQVRE